MKKKSIFIVIGLLSSSLAFAQAEMDVEWTKSFDHKTEKVGTGLEGDGEVSYISDSKTMHKMESKWPKLFPISEL